MKRLILMRHGEAESDGPSGDVSRPLSLRGRSAALRSGQELRARGLSPDHILCSGAQRTRQSLEAVVRGGGFAGVPAQILDLLYLAEPETIVGRCYEIADTVQTLLVIGHNPGFSDLATELARYLVGLDTAQAAVLEKEGASWLDVLSDGEPWKLKGILP